MGVPRFARKRLPVDEVGVSERGPIVRATPRPSKDPAPGRALPIDGLLRLISHLRLGLRLLQVLTIERVLRRHLDGTLERG